MIKLKRALAELALCFIILGFFSVPSAALDNKAISFAQNEEKYINSKEKLRVAVISSWKPYSYTLEKNGEECAGYAIDLLARIEEQTGIEIEMVVAQNYQDAIKMKNQGTVDITAVEFSSLSEDDGNLIPYLTPAVQILTHKDTDLINAARVTVAVVDGIDLYGIVSDSTKQNSMTKYSTMEECMNAVRGLRADVAVCDQYTAAGLDAFLLAKDLMLKSIPEQEMAVGFGISEKTNPAVISIIEKVLATDLPEEKAIRILKHCENVSRKDRLTIFVFRRPFEIICVIIALAFVALICLWTYTRVRLRHHRVLHGYEEGYRMLADTLGEIGMEYDYMQDKMIVFGKKKGQLALPEVAENFRARFEGGTSGIRMSEKRFLEMLKKPRSDRSYDIEFQCEMSDGSYNWFRMIYIVISTEESHRRPIRMIGCLVNIEEEYREKTQLMERGMNDKLTGLLNRWSAEEMFGKRLQEKPTGDIIAIIDLDHFKDINDTYGHLCGDDALRTFGMVLRNTFGQEHITCRWGGDEFLVYYKKDDNSEGDIEKKFLVLRDYMRNYGYEGKNIPITLSIGALAITREAPWQDLFRSADEILYRVKQNGRDNFILEKNKR